MHWRIKGAIQKALGYVPIGAEIHYRLQRRAGGLRQFRDECASKIDDWRLMIGHMRAVAQPIAGAIMMEMGTGWYPTFPFCSYLAGAAKVHTVDLNRHLKLDLTAQCVDIIGDHLDLITELGDLPREEVTRRYDRLRRITRMKGSLAEATENVVRYGAPADASQTKLPDGSIDWTFSNSVLEHVPEPVIAACMHEAFRILRPGGFMFHSVNCGDHYAYADSSITQLNYLRYSDREWELWNNEFLYQNRLRAKEFARMAEEAGFELVVNTAKPTERRLRELRDIPVHESFRSRYTPEELCITTIDLVGKRPAGRRL